MSGVVLRAQTDFGQPLLTDFGQTDCHILCLANLFGKWGGQGRGEEGGEGGEGRKGGSGRGGGNGVGVQWGRSPVGGGPGKSDAVPVERGPLVVCGFRSLVVANISHVSNLVWVFRGVVLVFWAFSFEKTLSGRGVTRCPESPDVCIFCQ